MHRSSHHRPGPTSTIRTQATQGRRPDRGLRGQRIINEPTAAALRVGLDKKEGTRKIENGVRPRSRAPSDISIIRDRRSGSEHAVRVLSTNGDTASAGEDFDQAPASIILATSSRGLPYLYITIARRCRRLILSSLYPIESRLNIFNQFALSSIFYILPKHLAQSIIPGEISRALDLLFFLLFSLLISRLSNFARVI